jgi:hypothetical protein
MDRSPVKGVLPTVYMIKKLKKRPRPNNGITMIIVIIIIITLSLTDHYSRGSHSRTYQNFM